MSEQVRKQTIEQIRTGQNDLSGLSASKDLHQRVHQQPSNATDLASVSISSSSFVRSAPPVAPGPEKSQRTSTAERLHTPESKHQANQGKVVSKAAPGIFKNPTYPYSGGLASKIITFLANLLKVLERIFLRLLGARDLVTPAPRNQPSQTKPAERKEPKESKRDELGHGSQVIHRS